MTALSAPNLPQCRNIKKTAIFFLFFSVESKKERKKTRLREPLILFNCSVSQILAVLLTLFLSTPCISDVSPLFLLVICHYAIAPTAIFSGAFAGDPPPPAPSCSVHRWGHGCCFSPRLPCCHPVPEAFSKPDGSGGSQTAASIFLLTPPSRHVVVLAVEPARAGWFRIGLQGCSPIRPRSCREAHGLWLAPRGAGV